MQKQNGLLASLELCTASSYEYALDNFQTLALIAPKPLGHNEERIEATLVWVWSDGYFD